MPASPVARVVSNVLWIRAHLCRVVRTLFIFPWTKSLSAMPGTCFVVDSLEVSAGLPWFATLVYRGPDMSHAFFFVAVVAEMRDSSLRTTEKKYALAVLFAVAPSSHRHADPLVKKHRTPRLGLLTRSFARPFEFFVSTSGLSASCSLGVSSR